MTTTVLYFVKNTRIYNIILLNFVLILMINITYEKQKKNQQQQQQPITIPNIDGTLLFAVFHSYTEANLPECH